MVIIVIIPIIMVIICYNTNNSGYTVIPIIVVIICYNTNNSGYIWLYDGIYDSWDTGWWLTYPITMVN